MARLLRVLSEEVKQGLADRGPGATSYSPLVSVESVSIGKRQWNDVLLSAANFASLHRDLWAHEA